jgi:membrane-bound serine protease (ClpP class)
MFSFGPIGLGLLLAGVTVIGLEVLIPSAGLLMLTALLLLSGGGWFAAREGGTDALIGYSISALVLSPLSALFSLKLLPHTPMGRRMILKGPGSGGPAGERRATEEGLDSLIGVRGTAATALRPVGVATLGGRRVDVVTRGLHVAAGAALQVVKVEGNRVIVEATAESPPRPVTPGEPA